MSTKTELINTETLGTFNKFTENLSPTHKAIILGFLILLIFIFFMTKNLTSGNGDTTHGENSPITKGMFNFFKNNKK